MRTFKLTKRGKLEIIFEILKRACEGEKKTYIMGLCRLSFEQLETYLPYLLKRGLLKKDGNLYLTTDRGKLFIEKYLDLQELMPP